MLERLICRADCNELQLCRQVSRVGLMRWAWLAGRVEQREGEWKITEAEGHEGNWENGAVTTVYNAR